MTTKELENYEPKGQLIGFPKEIIARMLECQVEQGNKRDVSVFEKDRIVGFVWIQTKEGLTFWDEVIRYKNFDLFFEKYPKKEDVKICSKCHKEKPLSEFHKRGNTVRSECKECRKQEYQENNKTKDNSQEFRVGDKVIYFPTNKIGILTEIKKHKFNNDIDIIVDYGNNDISEYEIRSTLKRPFLLHYRDDYNYDVIDLNNLPKRQEPKRWRAEENRVYYFVGFDNECGFFPDATKDNYAPFDDNIYNSGNYFRTKVEAKTIALKLNEYFKQLINPNK